MNILQITPGAGGMYCGACFRDNALVAAFRREGHSATLIPLYLPLTLDEPDQTKGVPIFFGGINVFLEEKSALFRRVPRSWTRWLDSPALLRWTGKFASRTRPEDVGELTVSMLKGEEGNQGRELDELLSWLKQIEAPDVINISNVLLLGLVRRLRSELRVPVVATLQGEDAFLDALPEKDRKEAWEVLQDRAQYVDQFIAPSEYFGELMRARIGFAAEKLTVVPNGILLQGYETPSAPTEPPVIGYFARMCEDKGLPLLVDAFRLLKQRAETRSVRLKIGGGLGPSDEALVIRLKKQLTADGFIQDVTFCPNLDRDEKIAFFEELTVFSVPSLYGESFGLYLIEALAAGVPIVQPRHAAFPEIVEGTGGGVIVEPGSAEALADGLAGLLQNPDRAKELGLRGRESVHASYGIDSMARKIVTVYEQVAAAEKSAENSPS